MAEAMAEAIIETMDIELATGTLDMAAEEINMAIAGVATVDIEMDMMGETAADTRRPTENRLATTSSAKKTVRRDQDEPGF